MGEDAFGLVGACIDARYRVDQVIGEGGFAIVYRGLHLGLGQPIAVKCLKIPAHFTLAARDTFWQRFREEGKVLAKLAEHPSIVRVVDVGTTPGVGHSEVPYLVLEWLEGEDLRQMLDDRLRRGLGPLREQEALALLRPAVDAIALAHRLGIAHRDLKPGNIFVARTSSGSVVKVLDFGIAKAMQEGERVTELATNTSSGFSAFSPHYGAPEQFRSNRFGPTGPWTDVHALGLVLGELVGVERKLDTAEPAQLYAAAVGDVRPTPREHGIAVSEGFEQLCAKALALMPQHRFPDAGAMRDAMDRLLSTPAPAPDVHHAASGAAHPSPAAGRPAADTADFVAERGFDLPSGALTVPAGPMASAISPGLTVPAVLTSGMTQPAGGPLGGEMFVARTVVAGPAPRSRVSRRTIWIAAVVSGCALVLLGLALGLALRHGDEPAAAGPEPGESGQGAADSPRIVRGPDNMVLVPAGEFVMGCPHFAASCPDDQRPAHPVALGAYYIDRTEVTVGQFRQCVLGGGCREPSSGAEDCNWRRPERNDHPVKCVDWSQADGYCRSVHKRLPTEAEWEKAARGTDGRTYPWGEQRPSCELAIMNEGGEGCGRGSTWPVGSRPAGVSPYGAYDMVGNVSEWVGDGYDPAYYGASPRRDPLAQTVSSPRARRGGSWRSTGLLRATDRDHWRPELWQISIGFRCARPAP